MSPAFLAETALLEVSQWQRDARDAQFDHRAVRIAADLWDECDEDGRLRDLTAAEQQFLTAVHQIDKDYIRVCGDAKRAFGSDSKAALAVEFTAKQRRDERFAGALDRYLSQRD